ncbi:MAG: LuxR C-terminal-related transcriptional regulator [Actinobacteria bacterium]|nr:LuxR C-terminal-related transcriptional regulator [Actinomycetota bacterium]MBU1608213.1 LuxR C-terminal-related transcriptional regulator [Actinomycetota bacterium]MBU2315708.1 LuxR C-terminal-related transcriptional regulator [Actinomycetota bacterium]MBU2384886.1 LuxR C-terminal-related transcriptional regulator [Actinomycetota bacterium]
MGSWPIVARPDHVDRLVDALAARPARAQMLRGPSGVGKTTVAATAASALAAKGRTIVPVVALDELRDVPLGALSPLLGAERFAPHDDVADRLQQLIALVGAHADTYLLVVDDAPLLDATSAAALYQLVRVFAVPALLTARDEHPMTGALARLLHEDLVTVTEVPGLGLDQTRELLRRRLGAEPRPETLRTLFDVTRGNPLFLRELVLSAERTGRVRSGPYGVELDPSRVPPHIIGTVASRLDTLRDDQRRFAELLAVAQPWPATATRAEDLDTVDDLVAGGFVVASGEGAGGEGASGEGDRAHLRLAHPIFAEALLADLEPAARNRLRESAARRLLALPSPPVRFTAVCLLLDAGATVARDDTLWAARYAHAVGDHERAIAAADRVLATATEEDAPALATAHVTRAAALSALGRVEEADEAFARAEASARAGAAAETLAIVHLRWGQHTALRRHEPRAAADRIVSILDDLDATGRALLEPDLAKWRLMAGDREVLASHVIPPATLDRARGADPAPGAGPGDAAEHAAGHAAELTAALGTAMIATMAGRIDDASAAIASGRPLAARFAEVVPYGESLLDLSAFLVDVARGRIDDARAFAEARRLEPFAESSGVWSYALALIHLHGGRLHDAAPLAVLAVDQLRWRDFTGLLGPALALASTVHAQRGDQASARAFLDALEPAHHDDVKVRLQAAEAQAWLAAAEGDPESASAALTSAVRVGVEAGHLLLAALTATVALRLSSGGEVLDLVSSAAAASGAPFLELVRRAAEAREHHDAAAAVELAPALTTAGLGALAFGLVSAAPGWEPDDRMLVRRARVTASELSRTVVSPSRPRHARDDAGLTEREWTVATAAARRERSREIAERLGVSVRTIDNHLSNIYRKLGVRGRTELERELREFL